MYTTISISERKQTKNQYVELISAPETIFLEKNGSIATWPRLFQRTS
jgi:hypothetical protein